MFKSKFIYDPNNPHEQMRNRQSVAKYGEDEVGLVYACVECNGVELPGTRIGFRDYDNQDNNFEDAAEYVADFNRIWVMVEQTVEALNALDR